MVNRVEEIISMLIRLTNERKIDKFSVTLYSEKTNLENIIKETGKKYSVRKEDNKEIFTVIDDSDDEIIIETTVEVEDRKISGYYYVEEKEDDDEEW
jgi:hypothetical protein